MGRRLDELDLRLRLSRAEEAERLAAAQTRLTWLRLSLGGQVGSALRLGPPLCVVFEGWDASGKGGCIRRLVAPLDPRHVRVASFAAPTYDEKRHHYLWRFWPQLPGWGGMAVLDRSWYGRVLVERVEGFATEDQWRRAYEEINGFEHMLLADDMRVVKIFLHITPQEQLRRFRARLTDPLKRWKLSYEDFRNRGRWQDYEAAIEEMVEKTSTRRAPWYVIPANNKPFGRLAALRIVADRLSKGVCLEPRP